MSSACRDMFFDKIRFRQALFYAIFYNFYCPMPPGFNKTGIIENFSNYSPDKYNLKFHRFLKVFGDGSHIFPNLGYLAEKAGI